MQIVSVVFTYKIYFKIYASFSYPQRMSICSLCNIILKIILSIYLFLAVLGLYCCTSFSLIAASGDSSLVAVCGLLLAATFLVAEHRLYGAQAQQLQFPGSRAQAQQLWYTGLVPPWHVGSSWTGDRTHISCVGRWILCH